ncbi:MAG: molybdopterin-dependent oxidoreductase [Phormidesmis sp.]
MPPTPAPRRILTRRHLLQLSGLSSAGLLLDSCGMRLPESIDQPFKSLNLRVGELLLKPQSPVPEYDISAIQPEQLLINSFNGTPEIDSATFQLTVDGAVNQPVQLSLAELQAMPLTSMVIRHVCVEGWAAIVQWGGVRLQDIAQLVQPTPDARYVYFESADGYLESWDLRSAMHPQTLMAYQKNGELLPAENGAPLRLAGPVKLGYKQSKWVTRISFTTALMAQKGYWVDRGYEWFAGL